MENHEEDSALRFSVNESSLTNSSKKYAATAKYDRKALQKRLKLEEWIHNELLELYCCEDDKDAVDLDVDVLVNFQQDEQIKFLKELLTDAKRPTQEFIAELLEKIKYIEDVHVKPKPTAIGDF